MHIRSVPSQGPSRFDRPSRIETRPEGPAEAIGALPTTGKGITIAVLDGGIKADHPDFAERVLANIDAQGRPAAADIDGHGTHVASDALSAGTLSGGKYRGPAPDANLVSIRVVESEKHYGRSQAMEKMVDGLHWVVDNQERLNIRVVNLSVGHPIVPSEMESALSLTHPLYAAISQAVRAGIVVVAAAGNQGPKPGSLRDLAAMHPEVITVGALDTLGTPTDPSDDRVADFSSRGPDRLGQGKPDLLAPGVNIMGARVPGSFLDEKNQERAELCRSLPRKTAEELVQLEQLYRALGEIPQEVPEFAAEQRLAQLQRYLAARPTEGQDYLAMHGSSMAAPITAGVVAAMLEANPSLQPAQVKQILRETARPLPGVSPDEQGAGALQAQAAVARALATSPLGPPFLLF